MNERIDVLAVMDRAESICAIYDYDGTANSLIAARAAVAELIEAARRSLNESEDVPAGIDVNGSGWWSAVYRALARVGGA